ncbi:MAG: hypothetical protein HC827_05840 [Cyanobacteria bacterium RM1_2_2]|nr:hypothetical protein [Cyanobacteria bacterium RM1_2_2]
MVIEANSFWSIDVLHPGNVIGSRLRGEIRKSHGGDVVATFRFDTPIYEETADQTRFRVYLRSAETEKIPVPPTGQSWIYDLLMLLPTGDYKRILKGTVFVDPGVTDV